MNSDSPIRKPAKTSALPQGRVRPDGGFYAAVDNLHKNAFPGTIIRETASFMTHRACATLSASSVFGLGGASHASDLPSYMGVMAGASRSSAGAIATKMVLPLDTGMNITWAAQIQVARWMGVVADWKKLLGGAWDKTYAAGNGIYVTCQNYILFSLAQFFGPDAINGRLILIKTISFARRYGELNG